MVTFDVGTNVKFNHIAEYFCSIFATTPTSSPQISDILRVYRDLATIFSPLLSGIPFARHSLDKLKVKEIAMGFFGNILEKLGLEVKPKSLHYWPDIRHGARQRKRIPRPLPRLQSCRRRRCRRTTGAARSG